MRTYRRGGYSPSCASPHRLSDISPARVMRTRPQHIRRCASAKRRSGAQINPAVCSLPFSLRGPTLSCRRQTLDRAIRTIPTAPDCHPNTLQGGKILLCTRVCPSLFPVWLAPSHPDSAGASAPPFLRCLPVGNAVTLLLSMAETSRKKHIPVPCPLYPEKLSGRSCTAAALSEYYVPPGPAAPAVHPRSRRAISKTQPVPPFDQFRSPGCKTAHHRLYSRISSPRNDAVA